MEATQNKQLPDLVLENIIKKLNLSSLTNFSLVNRRWRQISIPYLFKKIKVVFNNPKHGDYFFEFIKRKQHFIYSINFTKFNINNEIKNKILANFSILRYLINLKEIRIPHAEDDEIILFNDIHLLRLLENQKLTSLHFGTFLDCPYDVRLPVMNRIRNLINLTSLTLSHDFPNVPPKRSPFNNLPNLKYLECKALHSIIISLMNTKLIQTLETWNILSISSNNSTLLVLALEMAYQLEAISITYTTSAYNVGYFNALSLHKKIKRITLEDHLSTPENDLMEFISDNPQLEAFNIYRDNFRHFKMEQLILNSNKLKSISFFNGAISTSQLEDILKKCTHLQSLAFNIRIFKYQSFDRVSEVMTSSLIIQRIKKIQVKALVLIISSIFPILCNLKEIEDLSLTINYKNEDVGEFLKTLEQSIDQQANFNLIKFKLIFNLDNFYSFNSRDKTLSDINIVSAFTCFVVSIINHSPFLTTIVYNIAIPQEQLNQLEVMYPQIHFWYCK